MAKKRRTKAQKIRAQSRRQTVQPQGEADTAQAPVVHQPMEHPAAAPAPVTADKPNKPSRGKPSDLRLSLVIFGGLIMVQLTVWLLFKLTSLEAVLPGNLTF